MTSDEQTEEGAPDPRLRLAVDASRAWYDDVFALHGRRCAATGGLWRATDAPPPWHSAAKTLVPDVPVSEVLAAVAPFDECSVADSFADLALDRHGFRLLFSASWLHHPPVRRPEAAPHGWSVVTTPSALAEWTAAHDYAGVLTGEVLASPAFRVLAELRDGRLVGGAVVHRAGAAAGLSNVWSGEGTVTDWSAVVRAAGHEVPGLPLVGYERGDDLAAAVAAGFGPVGEQRVWLR